MKIILKKLVNIERANRIWFDEAKSHLTISNKWPNIVKCYGLTQDPLNGKYMLVMMKLDMDLRGYLRQYHDQLSWNEKITIAYHVINALDSIHKENVVHRDLHSGNILYNQSSNYWLISDLGFCGPVDKPLSSIYGNIPYVAPENLFGEEHTKASDIYSIAMIMWEISSGQPPFSDYEIDYNLIIKIGNGMRPKIVSETPLKYIELMKQCWDADPKKRPDIKILSNMINDINRLYYPNVPTCKKNIFRKFLRKFKKTNANNLNNISTSEIMSCYNAGHASKIYDLNNLPEPKNATEGSSKPLSKVFQKLHIGPSNSNQHYHERSIINQQVKNQDVDDNDEICNNPNLHPEEQEEFEIPNGVQNGQVQKLQELGFDIVIVM
ncbi:kinase-like domain-containing protein [Rhizophagus diaphanus]|nr:kinase-like domain-containing protein [Rhizophagus diaphanus] [Rhizophagus sp. MUCL 43196]